MHILAVSPGEGFRVPQWQGVLESGIDAFMIRERQMTVRELLLAARWVQATAPGVALWINGRLDVALACRCGLHAPESYPEVPAGLLPLSRPIHEPAQFQPRCAAQQLLLSPIYQVPGKGPAWGPEKLHGVLEAMPALDGKILALGGITPENAGALRHPRLDGVAVIRAIWAAPDPARWVGRIRAAF